MCDKLNLMTFPFSCSPLHVFMNITYQIFHHRRTSESAIFCSDKAFIIITTICTNGEEAEYSQGRERKEMKRKLNEVQ